MRAVVQRVSHCSVTVDGEISGKKYVGGIAGNNSSTKGIYGGLDYYVGEGKHAALQTCGNTYAQELEQFILIYTQLFQLHTIKSVALH